MNRSYFFVFLVMLTFFVISFLTNILGPIMPAANSSLNLSLALAGFLPLSFFIAYGPTSIPAGSMTEKYGSKFVMILGFTTMLLGCFLFAAHPGFITYVISLFIMGVGMAMLQVVINPLLRAAGGEEHYSFFSVLAQLCFGGASFLSPIVYSYLMLHIPQDNGKEFFIHTLAKHVPPSMPWVAFYWICGVIALLMIIILSIIKFPQVVLTEDEKTEGAAQIWKLLKNKTVIIYFLGIFAYVGTEQGVSVWISKFLLTYHQANPDTVGANTPALFWGMQCVGGILGLILLKLLDVRIILATFVIAGIIALFASLFGSYHTALITFPAVGFFNSVMYPGVFSLGLNSLEKNHGTFAGILCTGVIGGAIIPFLVGLIGNTVGLRYGMCLVFLSMAYMLGIAIFAKPLVHNQTIFNRKKI